MKQKTLPGFDQNSNDNDSSDTDSSDDSVDDNVNDNIETQEYEPVGFTPEERNRHLDQIQSDLEEIEGVEDVGWIAEPNYLDDAQFNIVLEHDNITLDGNYEIKMSLISLNSKIKDVLEDHEGKISSDFVSFRSPNNADEPNEYEDNLYEVDLMML